MRIGIVMDLLGRFDTRLSVIHLRLSEKLGPYIMPRRLLAIFILLSFQMPAFGVQDFTVTRKELELMPPYCTALYGYFYGLPDYQHSPLRNTIPGGCPSLHHYCDGLKAMIRAQKFNSESQYWADRAVESFQSVADANDWARCPLRPEAYVNLGRAQLFESKYGGVSSPKAALNFTKALELKPDYLPAYYALSDYYEDLGDKKKALGVVEDGLRHVPNAKGLLRRFKELGGTTPPTPIEVIDKPTEPDVSKDEPMEQQKTSEKTVIAPANDIAAPEKVDTPSGQPTPPPKIGNSSNKWCRFCPP